MKDEVTYTLFDVGKALSGGVSDMSIRECRCDGNGFGTVYEVGLILSQQTHLSHSAGEDTLDEVLVIYKGALMSIRVNGKMKIGTYQHQVAKGKPWLDHEPMRNRTGDEVLLLRDLGLRQC
jgi:hypothetical protein